MRYILEHFGVAVAAGAFVWWKYGKGKLPALRKKGVPSKRDAQSGNPEG